MLLTARKRSIFFVEAAYRADHLLHCKGDKNARYEDKHWDKKHLKSREMLSYWLSRQLFRSNNQDFCDFMKCRCAFCRLRRYLHWKWWIDRWKDGWMDEWMDRWMDLFSWTPCLLISWVAPSDCPQSAQDRGLQVQEAKSELSIRSLQEEHCKEIASVIAQIHFWRQVSNLGKHKLLMGCHARDPEILKFAERDLR